MASKNPYVSVVIPTYNRAEYLGAAIDSVLNQKNSGCSYEIIVVDDGSTDGTEKLMQKYKGQVRYYKIKHTGLPAVVRNAGVSKAKGELIAFQDSDDLWTDDKLAKQIPVFKDPSVLLSFGQAKKLAADGRPGKTDLVATGKLKSGETFDGLIKENVISTLTVMMRRSAFAELGGFDESLYAIEDYELWLRLAARHPGSIKPTRQTLAYYRTHSGNISAAGTLLAIERLITVYDRLWDKGRLDRSQRLALEAQMTVMQENWSRQQNIDGNTPMISVVMSIYNTEKYLREAVDSILSQTYKNFEFIIINDGSTDNSAKIIREYNDPRIRLISQTNHGLVFSFNKGVQLARAKYIARMDSDDISLPSRFKKELAWLEAKPARGLVGSYFAYMDTNSNRSGITLVWPTKHLDLQRTMYYVNPFGHGTIMMRREAVIGVGGYRAAYEPSEDFDLWARIARHWEIGQIPEVLYLWRFHEASISRRKSEVSNKAAARVSGEMWGSPVVSKPIWSILRDAYIYKHMASKYNRRVYREYSDNQSRLAVEFIAHKKFWIGYKTAFAALILSPRLTLSYWKDFLRPPLKLVGIR